RPIVRPWSLQDCSVLGPAEGSTIGRKDPFPAQQGALMETAFLAEKYQTALRYEAYVGTGTDEQQRRWRQVYEATHLTPAQAQRLAGFSRQMRVLVVSGIWCGDCVEQCPLLQRAAEANPKRIDVRFLDRDQHRDLSTRVRLNGGDRVPVVLFL